MATKTKTKKVKKINDKEWLEETDIEEISRKEANIIISNFIELVRSRYFKWEEFANAGKRIVSKKKLDIASDDYKKFYSAYEQEKDKQFQNRMWPIRDVNLPKPIKPKTKRGISLVEWGKYLNDANDLLNDIETALENDNQLALELIYLKDEVIGLYEVKSRIIASLLSAWTGGARASATGMNIVLGGNPGTGKTSVAAVLSKITTLMGWITRPPSNHRIVIELNNAIEKFEIESGKKERLPEEPSSPISLRARRIEIERERRKTLTKERYGIIPKDREDYYVFTSREHYVAGFAGQTTLRTLTTLRDALGKFLFIDEAYSLITGPGDEFGIEILNVLVNWIPRIGEARLGLFAIAGYVDRLKKDFFRGNEGLQSRFPLIYVLPNYTPVQLSRVFLRIVEKNGWMLEFPPEIEGYIETISNTVGRQVVLAQQEARAMKLSAPVISRKEEEEEEEILEEDLPRWRRGKSERVRTGNEKFLVEFFFEFQKVFDIGNIRKVQNYINLLEERWARDKIADPTTLKTLDWMMKLNEEKYVTLELMTDAMILLLTSSIGFEPLKRDEKEELTDNEDIDLFS